MNQGRPSLADTITHAAAARKLLVATDFDGTLAELVDDPNRALPVPGVADTLRALAALPATVVAIVSGRVRADLLARLGPIPGARLIGCHGCEWRASGSALTAREARLLPQAHARLMHIPALFPGTHLQPKPFGVALHTRALPHTLRPAALAAARAALESFLHLHEAHGKDIIEFLSRRPAKGRALCALARRHHADLTVFLGDDHPDEDAFISLPPGSMTVKVGPGVTAAAFRVPGPAAVAGVLSSLLSQRARRKPA